MDLKNLGHQTAHVLVGANAALLERVDNPCNRYLDDDNTSTVINITGDEFTSLCPATGGPDFGAIDITYIPCNWIVESKSLKYYLESFRNEPIFHEACVARICRDLGDLLIPNSLTIVGRFKPRGGWAIETTCNWYRR
jgi:7-cyano-7-deazaguanine reductase